MRDYQLYLGDILDAMSSIESFIKDIGFGEFRTDDKTASAIIRKFEVIGAASKGIPDDFRQLHPEIPWKEMAGMRDRLIHLYFGVDHELVWATIKQRLPQLKAALLKIQSELP